MSRTPERHPGARQVHRPRPVRAVLAQQQEARQRRAGREHVADVRHRDDLDRVVEERDQQDVQERVDGHRERRHAEAVELAELLDRHPVLGDPVERSRAVHRRRVHRQHEPRDDAEDHHAAEEVADERVECVRVPRDQSRVGGDRLRAEGAARTERQQHVDHRREQRRAPQRHPRVALRVAVLRRERRHHLDPVGRPAHEVEPHERERQAAVLADVEVDVRARPVARDVRQEHQHERGDAEQRAGHVAEPDRGPHAVDVEQPDEHDQPDADHDRQAQVEARAARRPRRVGEPLGLRSGCRPRAR